MATLTERFHAGAFVIAEADGRRSGDEVVIAAGRDLVSGTVLGRRTVGASATPAAFAGNTGDGAMGAITVGAGAKAGVYKLIIIEPATDAGAFTVEDPDGAVVGTGNVDASFNAGGLAFTLADGATDFIAGDGFTITVAAGSGKYVAYDPTAGDGSNVAAGILMVDAHATSADIRTAAIARSAKVHLDKLVWGPDVTTDQHKADALAQLEVFGIVTRSAA